MPNDTTPNVAPRAIGRPNITAAKEAAVRRLLAVGTSVVKMANLAGGRLGRVAD
jgi:hypothetical protein